jgi:LacI family transcriptional regulator
MGTPRIIAVAIDLSAPFPHHQEVFEGMRRYAVERGNWQFCLDEYPGYHSRSRGSAYPRYDGVIARVTESTLRRFARMRVPFVNTHYQEARPGMAGVYPDPQAIGPLAARHLVERGCRRIALFGLPEDRHWRDAGESACCWARSRGIDCDLQVIDAWPYRDAGAWVDCEKRFRAWLQRIQPPVGVFAGRPEIARMLHQFASREGIRIPNDLAILSYQDASSVLETEPRISYIRMDHRRVGYEAARLLDHLMAGAAIPAVPWLIPPVDVALRESTGFVGCDDPLVAVALAYIEAHISTPLRVEDLAAALSVSRRLLQQRFADFLGRGVSQEVRRLRVEFAKRLLRDGEQTLDQIAKASGFGSRHMLSEVFRREVGASPADYRQRAMRTCTTGSKEPLEAASRAGA